MRPLTPRQQRFVDEYLVDLNATQAAIRAGYSAKTAQESSSRLLSNVMIATAIRERQGKRQERTEITQDFVLNGLRLNAEMALGLKRAPSGKYEWEPAAANRAYELLGKHLGMLGDRLTITDERIDAELAELDRRRRNAVSEAPAPEASEE